VEEKDNDEDKAERGDSCELAKGSDDVGEGVNAADREWMRTEGGFNQICVQSDSIRLV
jgi:hypothetical protein